MRWTVFGHNVGIALVVWAIVAVWGLEVAVRMRAESSSAYKWAQDHGASEAALIDLHADKRRESLRAVGHVLALIAAAIVYVTAPPMVPSPTGSRAVVTWLLVGMSLIFTVNSYADRVDRRRALSAKMPPLPDRTWRRRAECCERALDAHRLSPAHETGGSP